MKIVTTSTQVPEVGDKVLVVADLENMCEPSAGNDVIGTIQSLAQHCRNCSAYCNVTDGKKIIDCPNVDELRWNAEKGYWEKSE